MTFRIRLIVLASGLVLAALLSGRALRSAQARTETKARLAATRGRAEDLRRQLAAIQRSVSQLGEAPPAGITASAAPAPTAATPLPPRSRPPGLADLAKNNPQLWNDYVQSKRAELGRFYLPVMQRLNLSAAQRERLKDILAEHLARSSDIAAAINVQGLEYADPAAARLRAENDERRQREFTELLGSAGWQAFAEAERATPMRGLVDGFAVQVARFAPLTSQQADELERAFADANAEFQRGRHGSAEALDWDAADRAARGILTPQQFAAWQLGVAHNSFGETRLEREMEAAYRRAVDRAKTAQAAATPPR